MSTKCFVESIEDATRGYDINRGVNVYIEGELIAGFWLCQDMETDEYIICAESDLVDLHYM